MVLRFIDFDLQPKMAGLRGLTPIQLERAVVLPVEVVCFSKAHAWREDALACSQFDTRVGAFQRSQIEDVLKHECVSTLKFSHDCDIDVPWMRWLVECILSDPLVPLKFSPIPVWSLD